MPFIDFVTLPKTKVEDGVFSQQASSGKLSLTHFQLKSSARINEQKKEKETWFYLTEGQLEFYLDKKREVLIPGMAVYISKDEVYSALALTECKYIEISCD